MTYDEALDFIYSRRKFQKSCGHERIERLLELLGNPQKKLKFVHVVGTNGKGSVSTALSDVLYESGYKVGLFTSPFVVEFGERIKVNGEFIPKSEIAEITSVIRENTLLMEKEGLYPTVFEVTTALGLAYYEKTGCDIVVLEAGIGGKNDSTNVIDAPELAVITSVSVDHMEMLGESITEIAREKCGILKSSCPVVSYPFEGTDFGYIPQSEEAAKVIKEECLKGGNPLYLPDTDKLTIESCDLSGTSFCYDGLSIRINICGKHQTANMLTVVTAARVLRDKGYSITDSSIQKGIAKFRIPGRTEIIEGEPTVILDGGHNVGCMKALKETAESFLKGRKITLLMSFMKDKEYEKSIEIIAPLCENIVFTVTDSLRGEKAEVLCETGRKYCKNVYAFYEVREALLYAKEKAGKDVLMVAGSFYLVSEVRGLLNTDCI
ncbi:MAG: bifunctional folylpolyglutamate synthase/dihydrofolate synthase [Clostridia bacterium]|nr:bifunctional folylpolyglutamate synthase/dihydrofolate synthase [Clostridia bacterium]